MPTKTCPIKLSLLWQPTLKKGINPDLFVSWVIHEAMQSEDSETLGRRFVEPLADHSDLRVCSDCGKPMEAHARTFSSTCMDGEPCCIECGAATIVDCQLLDHSPLIAGLRTDSLLLTQIHCPYSHPDHPAHLAREVLIMLVTGHLEESC